MIKEIIINSKKYGSHILFVDQCDFELVNKYKWHLNKGRNTFYASTEINKNQVRVHRLIVGNSPLIVDHIDGNGLNCVRDNIRLCTYSENGMNRKRNYVKNKSGYKGVWFCSLKKKYKSQITALGKRVTVGTFSSAKDAALAYNDAAKKYHGIFANLNDIRHDSM